MMAVLRAFTAALAAACTCALTVPRSAKEAVHDPISSVQGLISRLLGAQYGTSFNLTVIAADPATGNDVFELDQAGALVVIRGNTGVSLASGLHWYLKNYCNASISWGRGGTGNQLDTVPPPSQLPPVMTSTRVVSPYKYRYLYNVCTYGYTTAWWNSTQWQEEIDRMALWGINLPLAFAGQEYITLQTFTAFNLTQQEVLTWMTGPAFLPWYRMGNIQAWAGPLTMNWIQQQRALGHYMLGAMRTYGMTPMLAGFAGHIPAAFAARYPNANVTHNSGWGNFNATYSSDFLLEPTDPLFPQVGQTFYRELIAEFGTDHFYNMDTYNEMQPSSSEPDFLAASNAAVYNAMAAVDPAGVYVMQGWLFYNDQGFWTPPAVQAYLSGVPNASMLILDLFSEMFPVWQDYDSYYGKPFVWNMLQVFGGRRALYGNLTRIATAPLQDLHTPGSTMVGIGATPEAVEIVPIVFDLLFEMGWRASSPDVSAWVQNYAQRRYGVPMSAAPRLSAAMDILRTAAYNNNYNYGTTENFCWLEQSPQLFRNGEITTNATGTLAALRLFVAAAAGGEASLSVAPFAYDLVDLTRQFVCNAFNDMVNFGGREYQLFQFGGLNTTTSVLPTQAALGDMIHALDTLLNTNVNFMVGHWIADALSWAGSPAEAQWLQYNARNQITLWGPDGNINDYAAKNGWGGLVGTYYGPRWALHSSALVQSVVSGQPVDWNAYSAQLMSFQTNWTLDSAPFPVAPTGDTLAAATAILNAFASGDTSRYTVLKGQDAVGTQVDIYQATHTDVGVLAYMCNLDPRCLGFNTDGFLKNSTSQIVTGQPCDLYLKK